MLSYAELSDGVVAGTFCTGVGVAGRNDLGAEQPCGAVVFALRRSLYRRRRLEASKSELRMQWFANWGVYFVVGVSTGFLAFLISEGVEGLLDLKFDSTLDLVEKGEMVGPARRPRACSASVRSPCVAGRRVHRVPAVEPGIVSRRYVSRHIRGEGGGRLRHPGAQGARARAWRRGRPRVLTRRRRAT